MTQVIKNFDLITSLFAPKFNVVLFALLWATSIDAFGDERVDLNMLLLCEKTENSQYRLACYDKTIDSMKVMSDHPPAPNAQEFFDTAEAGVALAVKPHHQPSAADSDFGLQHKTKRGASDIEANIQGAKTSGFGKVVLNLDNDQVWRLSERVDRDFTSGQQVLIRRGVLNAFFLSVHGSSREYRVSRIK
jgi:hypothetical protein